MAADHDVMVEQLTRLQLTCIRDQLDNLLDEAAAKNLTLREAVAFLIGREVARKNERRLGMAFKIAHFPVVRELADFDFKAQPSVDRRQVRELAASLGRPRRRGSAVGSGGREVASGHRARARGDPPGLLRAVSAPRSWRARIRRSLPAPRRSADRHHTPSICPDSAASRKASRPGRSRRAPDTPSSVYSATNSWPSPATRSRRTASCDPIVPRASCGARSHRGRAKSHDAKRKRTVASRQDL